MILCCGGPPKLGLPPGQAGGGPDFKAQPEQQQDRSGQGEPPGRLWDPAEALRTQHVLELGQQVSLRAGANRAIFSICFPSSPAPEEGSPAEVLLQHQGTEQQGCVARPHGPSSKLRPLPISSPVGWPVPQSGGRGQGSCLMGHNRSPVAAVAKRPGFGVGSLLVGRRERMELHTLILPPTSPPDAVLFWLPFSRAPTPLHSMGGTDRAIRRTKSRGRKT